MSLCIQPHRPQIITNFQQDWGYTQSANGVSSGPTHDKMATVSSSSFTASTTATTTTTSATTKSRLKDAFDNTNTSISINTFQEQKSNVEGLFSRELLLHQFGDSLVRVSLSQSGRFDGPENGALWGVSDQIGSDSI